MGGLFSYFRNLIGSKEMRILILGLDGAGKTQLLKTLLKPTLMTATCHARCAGLASEEVEDCLALCMEVLEDPST